MYQATKYQIHNKIEKLLGIYNTKKEAEFIIKKCKLKESRSGYAFYVKHTDNSLYPNESYKVAKHLVTIPKPIVQKEDIIWK